MACCEKEWALFTAQPSDLVLKELHQLNMTHDRLGRNRSRGQAWLYQTETLGK